jgi:glycosyltransferase involved in cell wall biosynthesis
MTTTDPRRIDGVLHVLQSFRAEGCPRLALALLEADRRRTGRTGAAAAITDEFDELRPVFEAAGFPTAVLGWRRRGWWGLAVRTARLLDRLRPAGVVCHPLGLFHVAVGAAAQLSGRPLVVHAGNAPVGDPRADWRLRLVLGLSAPLRPRYAACSDHVRRALIAAGLPGTAVQAIPNGVDLADFAALRPARRPWDGSRPPAIGMVASFEGHKDQDTLLAAAAVLRDTGRPAKLLLVGDGSRREVLRRRAADLRLGDLVEFAGSVRDVKSQLARMDVFAFCVNDAEGLGIALVEAMASGLPAVGSDVGACREVLAGGRLGRLVPGRDPAVWADALWAAGAERPVPLAALSRYDILETSAGYDRLLGIPA